MPPTPRNNPKKILLVEGIDEEQVIYRLRDHAQLSENSFSVIRFDGYRKLMEQFPRELKASELSCLGVIVDADENFENRWQSLRDLFLKSGYELPLQIRYEGTILQRSSGPTIGLWIMPDNQSSGILEGFLGNLIPVGDPLWTKAKGCVDAIPSELLRFNQNNIDKAYIHTWLAWQKDPGMQLGVALRQSIFDKNSTHAQSLIKWLRQLFEYD